MRNPHHVDFLKLAWGVINQEPTFPKSNLIGFLPDRLYEAVGRTTTVNAIIKSCDTDEEFDEAFRMTTEKLRTDWTLLRASSKKSLIALITESGLGELFSGLLNLSENDEEELRIRWDISDALFSDAKKEALQKCYTLGLDFGRQEFRIPDCGYKDAVENIKKILEKLLEFKAEADVAVVMTAARDSKYKYIGQVQGRLRHEYLNLLVGFRESVLYLLVGVYIPDDTPLTLKRLFSANLLDKETLDDFKTHFETYSRDISTLVPSPKMLRRVAGLIGGKTMNITYIVNGDGNVVDSHGHIITVVNKTLANRSKKLAEDFAYLKAAVSEIEGMPDKDKRIAIRAIEDAEDESADEKPTPGKIEEHLKRATSVLDSAGKTFDHTVGWGARLMTLGHTLMTTIPVGWHWLAATLGIG